VIAKAINTQENIRVLQRKLYQAAKVNPRRKFGVLYDKMYRQDILMQSWKKVKANKGTPGVDEQSISYIEEDIGVDVFLNEIKDSLISKTYKPAPVKRVYIFKSNGKQRPLGIPTIADRVVQTCMKLVIEPIFEADFKDFSYGFRPKRSAHMAHREIYKYLNYGCRYVIDADVSNYFDTITHDILLKAINNRITDNSIVRLIKLWLKAGVMEDMQIRKQITGTPQGGVISPLLANLYLHYLDTAWEEKGFNKKGHDAHIVRYADDFVVLCSRSPDKYLKEVNNVIGNLKLELNVDKTKVIDTRHESFDFLGFHFVRQASKRTGKLKTYYYPTNQAMKTVKEKVRETVRTRQHWLLPELIEKKLNPIIRGWANYFKGGNSREHFKRIDRYITMTLCIMLRKKHKKRAKGWRDHPPSWFYNNHGLYKLADQVIIGNEASRYAR